jgi:hypothetical protein
LFSRSVSIYEHCFLDRVSLSDVTTEKFQALLRCGPPETSTKYEIDSNPVVLSTPEGDLELQMMRSLKVVVTKEGGVVRMPLKSTVVFGFVAFKLLKATNYVFFFEASPLSLTFFSRPCFS